MTPVTWVDLAKSALVKLATVPEFGDAIPQCAAGRLTYYVRLLAI